MRNETIWAIRDARGLSTSEKAFLFVVESRGTAKTYRQTLMNDTGASDGQITNLVRSLTAKGCIETGRVGRRTTYRVSHDAVARLVPDRIGTQPVSDGAQSVSPTAHSVSAAGSPSEDNKKNRKKNVKENQMKNKTAPVVADAPTVTAAESPLPKKDRESNPEPSMGAIWVSVAGDVLFEADAGSGVYMLSDCGVSALPLLEPRSAPPVDHGTTDAAPHFQMDRELAECRRRWAASGETGWKATEARLAEEDAIRVRHGVPVADW